MRKLSYYQGGGGVNEPTPGKTKYKAEKAILVQPRFEEPLYKNFDYLSVPGKYGPGSGYTALNDYKSIKEFLEDRRKLKEKYKAKDSYIEDTPENYQERLKNMKIRANLFSTFIIKNATEHFITKCKKCGTIVNQCRCYGPRIEKFIDTCKYCSKDNNNIDFPIDNQIDPESIIGTSENFEKPDHLGPAIDDNYDGIFPGTVGLGDFESYPYSAQIGGLLDKYLPLNDFEGKAPTELDFGRDYTEGDVPRDASDPSDEVMKKLMQKYLNSGEGNLYGLPDGIYPQSDLDANNTINDENPYYGVTDVGTNIYDDKWNI